MRLLTLFSFALVIMLVCGAARVEAQGMPLPAGTNIPVPQQAFPSTAETPPSMQNQNFAARPSGNPPAGRSGGWRATSSRGRTRASGV